MIETITLSFCGDVFGMLCLLLYMYMLHNKLSVLHGLLWYFIQDPLGNLMVGLIYNYELVIIDFDTSSI